MLLNVSLLQGCRHTPLCVFKSHMLTWASLVGAVVVGVSLSTAVLSGSNMLRIDVPSQYRSLLEVPR